MSHHFIELANLHYRYPDGNQALAGISCRIEHGESVAIIGHNGAGKSTLLLNLNGSLLPTEGSLNIGGIMASKKTVAELRRAVGLVFQNADDQLFMPTIYDDVAFGPLNFGLDKEQVKKRVEEALNAVGLMHLKDRPPYHLSTGEKKKTAIASVLALEPNILVMDEPSANLDPKSRRELIHLLSSFSHTKIVATHDLDLVLDLCDRTIILHDGKIARDGKTKEILKDRELLARHSLELPLQLQGCPICSANKTIDSQT